MRIMMLKKSFSTFNFYSRRLLSLKQSAEFDWVRQEKILMAPFEYVQNVPNKYYALMAPCFDHWLQVPEQKLDIIQDAMLTMMSWIILLDDIQDDSAYRYGVPSAHRTFGVGLTINAANKALLLGQKRIAELEHPLATQILLKVHDDFFYGQGIDIYWRDNNLVPTEGEHFEIIKKKSGSLFALPVEVMQLFSTNKADCKDLAVDVGIYFAMVDDYYSLFQPKALNTLGKVTHENHFVNSDITESKMTLAIIHASQFPDVGPELADILKQRTSDPKLMDRAVTLMKKHGSDKYAKDVLKSIEAEIRAEIDRLGGNPKLEACIDDLSMYL